MREKKRKKSQCSICNNWLEESVFANAQMKNKQRNDNLRCQDCHVRKQCHQKILHAVSKEHHQHASGAIFNVVMSALNEKSWHISPGHKRSTKRGQQSHVVRATILAPVVMKHFLLNISKPMLQNAQFAVTTTHCSNVLLAKYRKQGKKF